MQSLPDKCPQLTCSSAGKGLARRLCPFVLCEGCLPTESSDALSWAGPCADALCSHVLEAGVLDTQCPSPSPPHFILSIPTGPHLKGWLQPWPSALLPRCGGQTHGAAAEALLGAGVPLCPLPASAHSLSLLWVELGPSPGRQMCTHQRPWGSQWRLPPSVGFPDL